MVPHALRLALPCSCYLLLAVAVLLKTLYSVLCRSLLARPIEEAGSCLGRVLTFKRNTPSLPSLPPSPISFPFSLLALIPRRGTHLLKYIIYPPPKIPPLSLITFCCNYVCRSSSSRFPDPHQPSRARPDRSHAPEDHCRDGVLHR